MVNLKKGKSDREDHSFLKLKISRKCQTLYVIIVTAVGDLLLVQSLEKLLVSIKSLLHTKKLLPEEKSYHAPWNLKEGY